MTGAATRVVVAGEALVDVLGDVTRPGGASLNVAVGVGRLGSNVAWLGPVGSDEAGELIVRHLAHAGVATHAVVVAAGATTRAIVEVDAVGHPRYHFEVDGTSCDRVALTSTSIEGAHVLCVVGGAIAFDRAPLGTSLVELVRSSPTPVWLDPNVRRGASTDPLSYARLVDELVSVAALVKTSTEDLGLLCPSEDPWSVARRWSQSGPSMVVVTDGSAGLTAVRATGQRVHVPALAVEVVDTVGAGDAVTAALLHWGSARGALDANGLAGQGDDDVRGALRLAARAAAIACSRQGSDPPTAVELMGRG